MYGQLKLTPVQAIWRGILFGAMAFTALEGAISLAFSFPVKNWHIISDLIIMTVFIIDFFRKIKHHNENKKSNDIAKTKLPTVIIDITACIPYDVLAHFMGLGSMNAGLKFLRTLKFIRIAKIHDILANITLIPKYLKIVFIVVCSTVAIHFIACGWIFINPVSMGDLYTNYNKSLYWAVTTLTTIGYGDITPSNNIGRLYTMVIMILGVGVYGIVIGNVTRMLSLADRYKEQSMAKMNELAMFMKHYNVPIKLQNAVFGFYNHLFTKRLSDNDIKIIAELPHPLQMELQNYMNMKLIYAVPAFKQCSHNCLKEIAQALEQMYFSPGQKIIKIGEIGHEMYIIGHGSVEMFNDKKELISTFKEGQFFGEVALLEERERHVEIKSSSYCDLYKLSKGDFVRIIKKYPELLSSMQNTMYKRSKDRRKNS